VSISSLGTRSAGAQKTTRPPGQSICHHCAHVSFFIENYCLALIKPLGEKIASADATINARRDRRVKSNGLEKNAYAHITDAVASLTFLSI
jgi:hypothetical protein